MATLKNYIARVADGHPLTLEEASSAFDIIMSGEATPSQIGAFLMALRVRGETVEEISGAVSTMRAKMLPVTVPAGAVDIVGTGGDGSHSVNISTASAIVVAGSGVKIAKHGNRAASSKTGTADVLQRLGVNLELDPSGISRCVEMAGIGFMFAPMHHSSMKHVGPTRIELGTRTIFNLVGPLTNPARVKHHVIGVFAPQWVRPLADVLQKLGSTSAWVVHGDGFDEITTTGETLVAELRHGTVREFRIKPEDVGLDRHVSEALRGGDADFNALALLDVLSGKRGAYRDAVLMNGGAALLVSGKVDSLAAGVEACARSIDSGSAKEALAKLVAVSNEKTEA
ncbi:anthranilate phosphoribosyltransferase [Limoniibacter endophyticus]|uniref:Anthranilate phosphoribosyltransferase n=1 Tax=Limoniibacter endophyticus TaxID=1565040 RepID=A0A8J3GFV1_9HYPH|nr:anthranilate phosphoribosyltransferase [Limoniibacter endophyticus]GHC60920.1 anthranilate phosphoribosyltransferase [Limoniibacter endophyticus]